MDTELTYHLKSLAQKYETKEFLIGDPSWFMHQVEGDTNKELLAFIASCLSYGSRKQFLPKIEQILTWSHGNITEWLINKEYTIHIPNDSRCFYRLYSNTMMRDMLDALCIMIKEYGSIKLFLTHSTISHNQENSGNIHADEPCATNLTALNAINAITIWFNEHGSKGIIPLPYGNSSCKRLCMFLRWMVRDNSPVDIGGWSDIIDKRSLIIPMDTHVIQEANRLGLLESKTASMSSAIKLTNKLKDVFPDDPLKGDFALFGLGVGSIPSRKI